MLFRSASLIYTAITVFNLIMLITPAHADEASNRDAQAILHMLDYVSVDYGGTVLYGKVLNEIEFKEQLEFSEQSATLMNRLPEHPNQAAMIVKAKEIANLVRDKSPAEQVSLLAQQLRNLVIETYQVPVSPSRLPETLPALALYQQLCVPCHGAGGRGDGPLSKTMIPKPANFHDSVRMDQRSIYGLYNSITLGVGKTRMTAYSQLSDEDRWALAFLVSNFRTSAEQIEQGRKFWENRDFQGPIPDLSALTTNTGNETSTRYGDKTRAVFRYLRSEPKALLATPHATLIFATEQLNLALTRYRDGNQTAAQQLAIAAYLEGFQPMETSLDHLDKQLRRNIEIEMMNMRQLIGSSMPVEVVARQVEHVKTLLKQADELLRGGKLSVAGAFFSALLILLKASFGGVLVLAALMSFVVKIGQRKALYFVHGGWGSAVLLGGLTWAITTWITEISGFSREIISGATALLASTMLIYFGFWLYHSAYGQIWKESSTEHESTALKRKVLWVLPLLSFFALYRATFEFALFYEALWVQTAVSTRPVLWSGILAATLVLACIGWATFRFGHSLSTKALFNGTSILLAALSLVFTGQGIASLQKAGVLATSPVDFISLPIFGIIPTAQTLISQLAVIGILILGYQISGWRRKRLTKTPSASSI